MEGIQADLILKVLTDWPKWLSKALEGELKLPWGGSIAIDFYGGIVISNTGNGQPASFTNMTDAQRWAMEIIVNRT